MKKIVIICILMFLSKGFLIAQNYPTKSNAIGKYECMGIPYEYLELKVDGTYILKSSDTDIGTDAGTWQLKKGKIQLNPDIKSKLLYDYPCGMEFGLIEAIPEYKNTTKTIWMLVHYTPFLVGYQEIFHKEK